MQPNAAMNRWIQGILLFDFELIHVPAEDMKGPDALLRRRPTEQEIIEAQEDDEWLDDFTVYVWEKHLKDNILNEQNFLAENIFIIEDSKPDHLLQEIKAFLENSILPEFDNEQG